MTVRSAPTSPRCKAIIDAGGDPDHDGFSGPLEFAGNGEPLEASYGLLQFGADNRIDNAATEYLPATAPAEADVPQVPVEGTRAGDGVLTIGTILPQTGSLAFLGPPEFAAFDLAIQDINAAGGVLGVRTSSASPATPATPRPTRPTRPSTACCRRTSTPSSAPRPRACR